jgi:hypothetical protein
MSEEKHSMLAQTRSVFSRRYRKYMEKKEDRLASVTTDRVVREFEWGLDWTKDWSCAVGCGSVNGDPGAHLESLNEAAIRDSSAFFSYQTPLDFQFKNNQLQFTSPVVTPYPENNVVHGRWFPASNHRGRAVLVLPHWNSQAHQHVALCKAIKALGISALRLSLPYHDLRMPPELHRADYAVSSNGCNPKVTTVWESSEPASVPAMHS